MAVTIYQRRANPTRWNVYPKPNGPTNIELMTYKYKSTNNVFDVVVIMTFRRRAYA